MMTHFVSDHVGYGEIPRSLEPVFQIVAKRQVDVNPVIARAIKRAHSAGRSSTCTGGDVVKHDQVWCLVPGILLVEQIGPHILYAGQYYADQFGHIIVRPRRSVDRLLGLYGRTLIE